MNLDQFREMKAAEVEAAKTKVETKPETKPEVKVETKPEVKVETKSELPDKITVDGIGEVSLAELKNGYLRGKDYTQKTQEIARQKAEAQDAVRMYELVQSNPEVAQELKTKIPIPRKLDPTQKAVVELEQRLFDLQLQSDIRDLKSQYPDFDEKEVLSFASERKMTNLEDAYKLIKSETKTTKSEVDVEELKKQLREDLLKEIENEKNTTRTVITATANSEVNPDAPRISKAEEKVALNMFRKSKDPIGEYIKWRGVKQIPRK